MVVKRYIFVLPVEIAPQTMTIMEVNFKKIYSS